MDQRAKTPKDASNTPKTPNRSESSSLGSSVRRERSPGGRRKKHATFGVGKKNRRKKYDTSTKIPTITPYPACKLRELRLERLKDWLLLEEEFLKNVQKNRETEKEAKTQEEIIENFRGSPVLVGVLEELIDDKHAIISVGPGEWEYYVAIRSIVDKEALEPNCQVLVNVRNYAIVGVMQDDFNPLLAAMRVDRAPVESFSDIGGLEEQIQELKEAVELPLTNPELFETMGIMPPRGVILYGPPGTGKTLLAKAVANSTSATFLHVVASELVQKTLGEGPKMVRNMFKLAQDYAPTIIFIDEVDAIGYKRNDSQSSGEKEVQRTMLELLNQLDGFDPLSEVKVIMATNNIQSLDTALIRPGRIDRKLEIPLPDEKGKKKIFDLQTSRMSLEADVEEDKVDKLLADSDLSGADIKAMCIEAGFLALRKRKMGVSLEDFIKAKERILLKKKEDQKDIYI